MKQDLLLREVLPFIGIWTLLIVVILVILIYHIWCFGKKYPEIFIPDTTTGSKCLLRQKAALRRRYNSKIMLYFSVIFIWMIGIVAICFGWNNSGHSLIGWFVLCISVCTILCLLSFIQRGRKK